MTLCRSELVSFRKHLAFQISFFFHSLGVFIFVHLAPIYRYFVEFTREIHGVWRDAWYNVNYDTKKAPTMRENPAFRIKPQSQIILRDFDAPVNVAEKYIQRLTGYLQVRFSL